MKELLFTLLVPVTIIITLAFISMYDIIRIREKYDNTEISDSGYYLVNEWANKSSILNNEKLKTLIESAVLDEKIVEKEYKKIKEEVDRLETEARIKSIKNILKKE